MVDGQTAAAEAPADTSRATDPAATEAKTAEATPADAAESNGKGKADPGTGEETGGDTLLSTVAGDGDAGETKDKAPVKADEDAEPDAKANGKDEVEQPELDLKSADDEKKADDDAAEGKDEDAKPDGDESEEGDQEEKDEAQIEGLPENFDWRELAADEKNRNSLKRFLSMDDLASFVREADSFRRRAVVPPNSKSTEEDIAKFHKAIGVPDSPEGYEYSYDRDPTDDDKARVQRLKESAHAVHLTPNQLTALVDFHKIETEAQEEREAQAHLAMEKQVQTELSREWGPEYAKNMADGRKFIEEMFGDYTDQFMTLKLEDGSMLGNSLILIKGAAKQGRRFGEAGIPGNSIPDDWNPTRDQLEEMMADPRYRDPARRDKSFVERVDAGFKRLYD